MIVAAEQGLRRIVRWIAVTIAITTTLLFPAAYFYSVYTHASSDLESLAGLGADRLSEFIYVQPDTWRFQGYRMEEILYKLTRYDRPLRYRLVGPQGETIVAVGADPALPVISHGAEVTDGGSTVARLRIEESLQPLLLVTLWVGLFSLFLGGSVYWVLRVLPMRGLSRVLARLEASQAALKEEVHAKETALRQAHEISEAMRRLAHHDPLTTLPNRLLFLDRLEQAVNKAGRSGGQLAVLFVDLDYFKRINDSLGHQVGDRLLEAVSRRLEQAVRREDTVSRFGGDEFTVIMDELHRSPDVGVLVRKLMACFDREFNIGRQTFFMTASVGVSVFPQDGRDAETLIRNADTAMYRAKEEGRNAFEFYTETMTAMAVKRVELETSLHQALEREEFTLYYQPQFSLVTGTMIGAEALLRWRHPEQGLILPEEIIPLAEETGQMVRLGQWILRTACLQLRQWQDAGLFKGRLAVNISSVQLQQDSSLPDEITTIMRETGCSGESLELEISEGSIMQRAQTSLGLLQRFRELGFALAIDDFGTGYSSLSYLKRFPITKLKIDKSLIGDIPQDADDRAISRAVITLAHSLQLKVVAEGVETEAQRSFLRYQGCDEAQGYLYGPPLPAELFAERFLASDTSALQPPGRWVFEH